MGGVAEGGAQPLVITVIVPTAPTCFTPSCCSTGEVVLYDWVEWLKEEHGHLFQLPQQQQ